ncbi:ester cyclase [Intrasporangium sp. DVR]|uniref:ester cyclase n=1 Tax=Intrasporangium sp. DVR TaxID=3127867 RepID=UPI00313A50E9
MDAATSPVDAAQAIFDALRAHDLTIFDRADHPDVVVDFVAVGVRRGIGEVRAFFEDLFAAFPDFAIRVVIAVGDGDHAVVQWQATGTFTGTPFQGIHATGRRIELRGCDVMRFEQGLLKHNTLYYDGLGFARAVGILPREGSVADRAMTAAMNAETDARAWLRRRRTSQPR